MGYDYLTPEQMYNAADPKPKQGVVYYEEKNIADTMSISELQAETQKGRFVMLKMEGSLAYVQYTQYYYTDGGNLKRDQDTGTLVMDVDSPFTKWIVIA